MQVLEGIAQVREALRRLERPFGLVPTMGYLHEGHLTLVRRARAENRSTAASIFVNPTQFSPTEDLAAYPRDLARDLALLEREGVDLLFLPPVAEMYPSGFDTWVEVAALSKRLEGAARPGHFRGVCTVVLKLFNILRPDRAYFGQKDAQQVRVIQQMAADLNTGVEIVVVPTVREPDGLAMSSRNAYLNPRERQAALVLSKSLRLAEEVYRKGGRDAAKLRQQMHALIEGEPLARIDYVSIADAQTLEELAALDRPALVSLAVRFGKARLIDNTTLE